VNGRSRPNTIEDVAREAGVSVATVSRAMRGLPNVAPSTREHVLAVAARLDYRADPSAARLAAGRTRAVAIAVPMLDSWYFSKVMAGAEAVLSEAGYDLLAFTIDSDERRHRALGGPLVKRVDGVILVDLRIPHEEATALAAGDVPIVTIGFEIAGASAVMVDDLGIAERAVEHLVALGHRDIALLGGVTDDPLRFTVPELRRAGYRRALRRHGIEHRHRYEAHGNFSVEGGREAMASLLDRDDPPTAVFAMSDEMAFGALREIWDRGLDVPGDVSVVGVDDHDIAAVVGLTTMQQEVASHGAVAARQLLDHLEQRELAATVRCAETTLVVRSTTGPAHA
jgi:LacI family transcriptional regulator, repressor for deo operon, udp, cdd, tsx, nupC, and nupG